MNTPPLALPVYYRRSKTLLGTLAVDRLPTGRELVLATRDLPDLFDFDAEPNALTLRTLRLEIVQMSHRINKFQLMYVGEEEVLVQERIPGHARKRLDADLDAVTYIWSALGVHARDYEALFDLDRFTPTDDDDPDLEALDRRGALHREMAA